MYIFCLSRERGILAGHLGDSLMVCFGYDKTVKSPKSQTYLDKKYNNGRVCTSLQNGYVLQNNHGVDGLTGLKIAAKTIHFYS